MGTFASPIVCAISLHRGLFYHSKELETRVDKLERGLSRQLSGSESFQELLSNVPLLEEEEDLMRSSK